MLDTLLTLLKVHNAPAPEIILEEDGNLGLDWYSGTHILSIAPSGAVNWSISDGSHGTDLLEFIRLLQDVAA